MIHELRQENSRLRHQLVTTQAKLQKLVATIQTISDSLSSATGDICQSACESGSEDSSIGSPPDFVDGHLLMPTESAEVMKLGIQDTDFTGMLGSINPCQEFIDFNWNFSSAQV